MKRVYIAIYDDRVAGVFDTWQKCQSFVEERVTIACSKWRTAIDYNAEPKDPFGTRYEFEDERGNHHIWYSSDYEVA